MTAPRTCSVALSLEVLGERWSLLVLREVFLGNRRFETIRHHTGAPRAILTARLNTLVDNGILSRQEYREAGARARQEYRLTSAGRELQPVLTALMQWGDKHLVAPAPPPLELRHRDCGGQVRAILTCDHGHQLPDTGAGLDPRPR
ncbi:winged helix-turn-helix transcriptional regulator [Crossiella cryophila]|uniref:DNA-binding HxlR family transcriptional regulator n=1 Tax=Crossiella cryophila TaxID=43355 RepID=A0A7W7FXA5_9PSEU|nr:helix-turn-helix domain-containing protein [Crossiella cryophila]MBB4680930.1 DNA-binding HxlR family transcriptional regulator [Crossiella cryophila]